MRKNLVKILPDALDEQIQELASIFNNAYYELKKFKLLCSRSASEKWFVDLKRDWRPSLVSVLASRMASGNVSPSLDSSTKRIGIFGFWTNRSGLSTPLRTTAS